VTTDRTGTPDRVEPGPDPAGQVATIGIRAELRRVLTALALPTLMLFVAVLTGAVVATFVTVRTNESEIAVVAARSIEDRLALSETVLEVSVTGRTSDQPEEIEGALAAALRNDTALTDVTLYSADRALLAAVDRQRAVPPSTADLPDVARVALERNGRAVGPITVDTERRFEVIQVATVVDLGVVVGTLRLDAVAPVLDELALSGAGDVYVVQNGTVVLHPDLSLQFNRQDVDVDRSIARGLDDRWMIRGSAPIADIGATVVAERPVTRSIGPVLWLALAMGAVMAVAVLFVQRGWRRLQRSVVAPIEGLIAETESIRRGEEPPTARTLEVVELEELSAAIAAMGDEIRERIRTIESTNVQLAASNRELEEFAYAASHDLQAPLRTVGGFLDLYDEELRNSDGQMTDRARHLRGRVDDGLRSMHELIDGLLAYSRITTRGADLGQPVDLAVTIDEVRGAIAHDLATAGATVEAGPLPTVEGDPFQLRQLLQNLIENAIKFRDPARDPVVRVEARRRPSAWEISVTDNGIGIPQAYQERIFVMFRRLHPIDRYPGQGLGLALCRRIAERHGGSIEVDSAPGVGSTFTVTLPDRTTPESTTTGSAAVASTEETS
jgi:signal transduction histidine kinase